MNEPVIGVSKLLELETELAYIKQEEVSLKARYETARDQIYTLFDGIYGPGACRFLSEPTGKVIAREMRPKDPSPLIDSVALEQNLTIKQWKAVSDTIRVLNEDKLVAAVEKGDIPKSLVDLVTSMKEPAPFLLYKDATKEERMMWEMRQNRRLREESA